MNIIHPTSKAIMISYDQRDLDYFYECTDQRVFDSIERGELFDYHDLWSYITSLDGGSIPIHISKDIFDKMCSPSVYYCTENNAIVEIV